MYKKVKKIGPNHNRNPESKYSISNNSATRNGPQDKQYEVDHNPNHNMSSGTRTPHCNIQKNDENQFNIGK